MDPGAPGAAGGDGRCRRGPSCVGWSRSCAFWTMPQTWGSTPIPEGPGSPEFWKMLPDTPIPLSEAFLSVSSLPAPSPLPRLPSPPPPQLVGRCWAPGDAPSPASWMCHGLCLFIGAGISRTLDQGLGRDPGAMTSLWTTRVLPARGSTRAVANSCLHEAQEGTAPPYIFETWERCLAVPTCLLGRGHCPLQVASRGTCTGTSRLKATRMILVMQLPGAPPGVPTDGAALGGSGAPAAGRCRALAHGTREHAPFDFSQEAGSCFVSVSPCLAACGGCGLHLTVWAGTRTGAGCWEDEALSPVPVAGSRCPHCHGRNMDSGLGAVGPQTGVTSVSVPRGHGTWSKGHLLSTPCDRRLPLMQL